MCVEGYAGAAFVGRVQLKLRFWFSILENLLGQTSGEGCCHRKDREPMPEVIETHSGKDKENCTTVLESGEIKGLKIWLGNALYSRRNFSGRSPETRTNILSLVLTVYNGVRLHLLSIPYNTLKMLALISSLLSCFLHFMWYSGFAFMFQIAIELGTCWVGLASGESNKQK